MAKKNKLENREDFQNQENYAEVKTDMPEGRFSESAQVSTAPETKSTTDLIKGKVAPNQQGVTASTAEAVKHKMSIRPASDSTLSDGKQVGGVPLGETAAVRGVAGVSNSVNVAVDESRSPYTDGGYRPKGRYDKKNSVDNFVINNIICEQIEPEFEESKDLRESPDAKVGYNGRKQFKTARGKKNAGSCPASLLFDRSVDFVGHGAAIHTTGQVINTITARAGYPTYTFPDADDPDGIDLTETVGVMKKSNYVPTAFRFTISRNGVISDPTFLEDQYIVDGQGTAIEASNMNWQIDSNNVTQTIVKLQTELGRETTDKWSPLGYVIRQPYEYNMLMHDMEATTGAIVGAAYKSAAASLAFNQNKMGKDGAKNLAVISEMFNGTFEDAVDSSRYAGATTSSIFNHDAYVKGSCAAMIDAFDSINKYTTKADFFNQQRSLKFHLQSVDNNLNPLHCKKEFFKALDSEYVFSTEDGNYNPMLPIHYTDKIQLINPLSLNHFLMNWTDVIDDSFDGTTNNPDTGCYNIYSYSYSDVRNNYSWNVTHPLVAGIMRWMMRHRGNLQRAYFRGVADNVSTVTVTLPIDFGMKSPNMFNFIVCSASQDILWCRNVVYRDVLFAGEQSQYIWNDLSSMKDINPLYASQFTYSDYGSPLKLGKLKADTAIRYAFPEKIEYRQGELESSGVNHYKNKYILPWYYNEGSMGDTFYQGTGWQSGNTPYVSTLPSIRGGVNHEAVDLLYSVDETDLILAYDRMTDIPVFTYEGSYGTNFGDAYKNLNGNAYQALCGKGFAGVSGDTATNMNNVTWASLRYDAQSDGRLIMYCEYDDAGCDYYRGLTDETYYCTPRQFGYIFPLITKYGRDVRKVVSSSDTSLLNCSNISGRWLDGGSFGKIIMYRALGQDLNNKTIDRTASLQQDWYAIYAYRDTAVVTSNISLNTLIGIIPSINAFIDGATDINTSSGQGITLDPSLSVLNCTYVLNSDRHSTAVDEARVVSLQNFMFTLLQRYFTPISIFDDCYDANSSTTKTGDVSPTPNVDPLEGAIYFGMAGCLGSDYNQLVLERLNIKDELGIYYLEDEFIKNSLIFRG